MSIPIHVREVSIPISYVADFCPICRAIQRFQFSKVCFRSYLIGFLPYHTEEAHRWEICCLECKVRLDRKRRCFNEQHATSEVSIDALIQYLDPKVLTAIRERLVLEQLLANNQLTENDRHNLVMEPFEAIDTMITSRQLTTHFDAYSARSAIITVMIFLVGGLITALVISLLPEEVVAMADFLIMTFAASVIISALCTALLLLTDVRRYIQKNVYPLVLNSLKPLKPDRAQLEDCFNELRHEGFSAPKHLDIDFILEGLKSR